MSEAGELGSVYDFAKEKKQEDSYYEPALLGNDMVNTALKQLGFTASEIRSSVKYVESLSGQADMTQEETVQECLKYFYKSLK